MKSQWKTEKTYFLNYLEKLFGVKNKSKFILFWKCYSLNYHVKNL